MPRLRHLMVAVLIACAAPAAFAQQTLEQQMTVEEFRAAGLDKLSAEELANLNRWLQGKVQQEASAAAGQAAEQAREEEREQARLEAETASAGRAGSNEVIQSSIAGEFTGFGRGQRYTLENGQVWEQIDAARLDGVNVTSPQVTIRPGAFGGWNMRIDGYNTRARVKRVN